MDESEPIGRGALIDDLTSWLRPAGAGRGRAALLVGEAGVGKSTLADAVADILFRDGFQVLRGWCSPAGMPPLWPWRRALAALAPNLRFDPGAAGPDDQAMLFAAVIEALERPPGPAVIVIDDAHWADPVSLALLRTLTDALPALPVAVLVTARDEPTEARHGLTELPTGVRRVPIPPLDDESAATLARRHGPRLSPAGVATVVGRAGGNPLFVIEVARLAAAHDPVGYTVVPAGVQEVLDHRLARLPQAAHRTLAAAAVIGETAVDARDPIDETLLARITDLPIETVTSHLDEASRAGLVQPDATGTARLRFAHALVREVLTGNLTRTDLGRLHRRAAEALKAAGADPERLAHHWARATGDDAPRQAGRWSLTAANAALDGLGFDQAVGHLRRALDLPGVDRADTLIRLGRALRLAGDRAGARQAFLDAAAATTDPHELAHAALGIGGGAIGFEVPIADDAQVGVLRRALAALGIDDAVEPEPEDAVAPDSRPLRAAVLGRLSLALTGLAGVGERRHLAERAVALADRYGDTEIQVGALAAYCDAVAGPDYVDQRLAAANRMLALATDHVPALMARRLRLLAYLERGDVAAADREIDAYRWAADAVGLPLYRWLPLIWLGSRALMRGDIDEALRYAHDAEALGRRADSFNAALLGQTLRMHAHLTAGTAAQIAAEIRELLVAVADAPLPVTYRAQPTLVLLAAGDPGPARAALRTYLATPAPDIAADAEWLEGHWALADAAIRLSDTTAAERLFEDLRPYERLWAVDGIGAAIFGTVGHQLGRLAELLGRHRTAAGYLAQAIADYDHAGAGDLAARARAEAGPVRQPESDRAVGDLRRDGPVWRIAWRGVPAVVKDSLGLRDLAILLAHANQPVPATRLAGTPDGTGGGLGDVLDPAARAAYRRRLAELDAEIDAGSETAERERAAIAAELAAATGLHGVRIAGDPADRARKAVTMRIRAAIRSIEAVHPVLAKHLRNSVKTGRLCAYEPDIEVVWRI
jgi:hypothetical protein